MQDQIGMRTDSLLQKGDREVWNERNIALGGDGGRAHTSVRDDRVRGVHSVHNQMPLEIPKILRSLQRVRAGIQRAGAALLHVERVPSNDHLVVFTIVNLLELMTTWGKSVSKS